MKSAWPFRFSVLLAIAFLIIFLTGVVVTDLTARGAATVSAESLTAANAIHRHSAETLGALVIVLAIWIFVADRRSWAQSQVKKLSLAVVGGVLLQALLGRVGAPLSQGMAFFHSFLAQLVFGLFVPVVVLLWPGWEGEATALVDKGWPSLRSLSRTTVVLIVIQFALGAAFRHNLAGVLWHILGAFVVVVFGVGLLVLVTQTPGGQALRPAVIALGVLMGTQVTLGMVLISISDQTKHPALVLYSSMAHVLTGASIFGVTILTAMLIRRSARSTRAA